MSLEHGALSNVELIFGYHCRVGLEVGTRVQSVLALVLAHGRHPEEEAAQDAGAEEPPSESLLALVSGVDVGEVVHEALLRNNGDTALISLSSAGNPDGEGGSEDSSDQRVCQEGVVVLILDIALVLPCPPLRAGHVLTEAMSHPRIAHDIIFQPISTEAQSYNLE